MKLVAFFASLSLRTYLIAAALVVFGIWTHHWYAVGYDVADQMWRQKALEAQIAKLKLELKLQQESDFLDAAYTADLLDENARYEKVIDAYTEELKNRPDKCLLGSDAERLQ